jgi:uncharacterized RDD family membrane protein YckC
MRKYDTFWRRFGALIIDGFALTVLSLTFGLIFWADTKLMQTINTTIISNITYVYSVLMIGKYGQTFGKMAMGVKVVDNDTGGKVDFNQAFKREMIPIFLVNTSIISKIIIFNDIDLRTYELSTLGYIIVFLPSFMSFIWSITEILTMLLDQKNRALHDKIADTVVVRT